VSGLEPLVRVSGKAMPLPADSIDTDVITPMPRVMDGTYVQHAFETLRFDADGTPLSDDPFADPRYAGAEILVTGANFGCGSSRETAAWAVKGMGYRVVISESFGDIFASNCFKNGVLPLRLPHDDVTALLEAAEAEQTITVDLEEMTVTVGRRSIAFELPELRRTALLEGLDDLDVALHLIDAIDAFETAHLARRPWIVPDRRTIERGQQAPVRRAGSADS
jgi:3-isopropylmalate/(R)-2-methylmalate dehydratase small subunit